jgi:hypothetical protein
MGRGDAAAAAAAAAKAAAKAAMEADRQRRAAAAAAQRAAQAAAQVRGRVRVCGWCVNRAFAAAAAGVEVLRLRACVRACDEYACVTSACV